MSDLDRTSGSPYTIQWGLYGDEVETVQDLGEAVRRAKEILAEPHNPMFWMAPRITGVDFDLDDDGLTESERVQIEEAGL